MLLYEVCLTGIRVYGGRGIREETGTTQEGHCRHVPWQAALINGAKDTN